MTLSTPITFSVPLKFNESKLYRVADVLADVIEVQEALVLVADALYKLAPRAAIIVLPNVVIPNIFPEPDISLDVFFLVPANLLYPPLIDG